MDELRKTNIKIENLIYQVRGKQVMLDSDLAKLYECKNRTKSPNLSVKRNINKFPEDFRFQLSKEECLLYSRFHFETLNIIVSFKTYLMFLQNFVIYNCFTSRRYGGF